MSILFCYSGIYLRFTAFYSVLTCNVNVHNMVDNYTSSWTQVQIQSWRWALSQILNAHWSPGFSFNHFNFNNTHPFSRYGHISADSDLCNHCSLLLSWTFKGTFGYKTKSQQEVHKMRQNWLKCKKSMSHPLNQSS